MKTPPEGSQTTEKAPSLAVTTAPGVWMLMPRPPSRRIPGIMRPVPPGGDADVSLRRGGTLGPAILLARLQFGTVLAVGLVAAVALGLWAAAPPFLDQVGAAQLKTTVSTADRNGDLSLTSRPVSYDPAKVQRLDSYVARSGAPVRLAGRVL